MTHDLEHERRLEQWLTDDTASVDPAVRARLAECRECEALWEAAREATLALEQAAATFRDDLAAAHVERDAPGEDLISADRLTPRARARRPLALVGAVLAIAAGLLLWIGYRDTPTTSTPPSYLGGSVQIVAPSGTGSDFSLFRWTGARAPGGWFVLIILAENGDELLRTSRLQANEYRPDATLVLPDVIEWRVESHDAAGLRGSASASASRR